MWNWKLMKQQVFVWMGSLSNFTFCKFSWLCIFHWVKSYPVNGNYFWMNYIFICCPGSCRITLIKESGGISRSDENFLHCPQMETDYWSTQTIDLICTWTVRWIKTHPWRIYNRRGIVALLGNWGRTVGAWENRVVNRCNPNTGHGVH